MFGVLGSKILQLKQTSSHGGGEESKNPQTYDDDEIEVESVMEIGLAKFKALRIES